MNEYFAENRKNVKTHGRKVKFDSLKEDWEYFKEHSFVCKWARFMITPPGLEKASKWEQIKLYLMAVIATAIIIGLMWWFK